MLGFELFYRQICRTDEIIIIETGNISAFTTVLVNAYIGRKQEKRNFRQLWITRISAAAKINGMNYSTFMNGLKKAGINLNRKMLSEIAISDKAAFTALCEQAKAAL